MKRSEIWASGWVFSVHRVLVKLNASGNFGGHLVYFRFSKTHLDLYVIQFYVVIALHLVKQTTKPLGFLLKFWVFDFSRFFSSAWLCEQSSINRNSSVVRPSVHCLSIRPSSMSQLSLNLCTDFFQISSVASPGLFAETIFLFQKNVLIFFLWIFFVSLTWDPMGAKLSKRYSSYQSQPKAFTFSWIFFPMVLTNFGNLKFWKLKC